MSTMTRPRDDATTGPAAVGPDSRPRGSRWAGNAPRRLATAFVIAVLLIGCVLPIVMVVFGSFGSAHVTGPASAWSRAAHSSGTLSSIGYSFLLAIRVPIALLVALVLAWFLVRVKVPGHGLIMKALWAAFFLPALPMTLGWILLLDPANGLLNRAADAIPFLPDQLFNIYSVPGILWVHLTVSSIPIMTVLLAPALGQLDASYEEASAMCGVRFLGTVRRITIPLVLPAILFAVVVGLIKSLEQFEVEQLLGVPAHIFVYGTRVYDLVGSDPADIPQAMALSTLFIAVLLGLALLYQWILHRRGVVATMAGKGVRAPAHRGGALPYLVSAFIWLGLGIAVLLPTGLLIAGSFNRLFGFWDISDPWTTENWSSVLSSPEFLSAVKNSLTIGLVIGALGTVLFGALAWTLARARIGARATISVLAWLPYALPGVLLGLAFLNIFLNFPVLNTLYGTVVPLVVVLLIQGMPLATLMIRNSVEQVPRDLEESSLMSGAPLLRTIRKITVPLVVPAIVSVFLISFMGAFRDISATVLVATPGTKTLPLLLFSESTTGDTESAAVVGVVMAILAVLVMLIVGRVGRRVSLM